MFNATARRLPDGPPKTVPCATAELAAAHLLMLMKFDKYDGDEPATLARLVSGEPVQHKRTEYRVEKAP